MAEYKIWKETALPGSLEAHSIYLIAPAAKPDYVEVYVTGAAGTTVKRVIGQDDVQALIDASISGLGAGIEIVADIAARNALSPTANIQVLVLDASADATVTSGAATYVYNAGTSAWVKIAEHESMDVTLNWAGIVGRPTSSVADIDDAVAKRHTHANKTQLDKVGEDGNGKLTYNGALPVIAWNSTGW
jgi:hypothetical protein